MNVDTKPYDPTTVKGVLCQYFNMSSDRSRLAIQERHFLGLGGHQFRYYRFTLTDGEQQRRAFGKTTLNHDREYRALQYLTKTIPDGQRNTSRPIASLTHGGYSLLLLEYLEGYSSPLSLLSSLHLFSNSAVNIRQLGKDIVDKIYDLQKQSPIIYRPLSYKDTEEMPCQPMPISVFEQLKRIKCLSIETKKALHTRINAIVNNQTLVRRGVIHGQLGMRNIMVSRSNILFIDWEYMQSEGFCLFDPCYMASMLLMRGVQLFIPRSKLDMINEQLFKHIQTREDSLTETANRKFIADALWFAKCVSMIDTLYDYERGECSRLKALLRQQRRKIRYLAYDLENNAKNRGVVGSIGNGAHVSAKGTRRQASNAGSS
jgi:hypothetical protein